MVKPIFKCRCGKVLKSADSLYSHSIRRKGAKYHRVDKVGWLVAAPGPGLEVPAASGDPRLDGRRWQVWAVMRCYFNATMFCGSCGLVTLQSRSYVGDCHTTYKCARCGSSRRWHGAIAVSPPRCRA